MSISTITQRFRSLRIKLPLMFVLLALAASGLTSVAMYINARIRIREEFKQRALSMVSIAALLQDGDLHSTLNSVQDQESSVYKALQAKNLSIIRANPTVGSIYTLRRDDQGNIYYVVYAINSDLTLPPAALGDTLKEPGAVLSQYFTSITGPMVEDDFYRDIDGFWLHAYAPITLSDGTPEAILGIDLSAEDVITAERWAQIIAVVMFLLTGLLMARIGWAFGEQIANPIDELTESVGQMSSGEFDRRVAVYSDDEVGKLTSAFNHLGRQIRTLINSLEVRVIERTHELQQRTIELENLSENITKRASRLQVISQIGQAIASVQEMEVLLPRITEVLSKDLGYYHVGIFLLDENREFALLKAANSEGGKKMLQRDHRLQVGQVGIVGYTASTGRVHIASDTGEDPTHFNNPDLPDTHSEMALPLRVGHEIIGVLDVQSNQVAAFSDEDVELLSIVANQASVAIQNALQFETTEKALANAESVSRQYVRQEWLALSRDEGRLGYRYSRAGVGPLKAPMRSQEIDVATVTGKTHSTVSQTQSQVVVPLKLRGEVIGVLNIKSDGQRKWNQDEIDISEAVAERVALAIENARLVEASQSQAARERTIGEIGSRIGSSVNMRNVLQTAVEELGRIMPGSDVVIQLGNPSNEKN